MSFALSFIGVFLFKLGRACRLLRASKRHISKGIPHLADVAARHKAQPQSPLNTRPMTSLKRRAHHSLTLRMPNPD